MPTADPSGDVNTVINLLWGEPASPKRGPKPGLTLAAIAKAGIDIADTDGLAAVTMQRVAEALGVTKMALYRYVPGKTELVALMTDTALGEPAPLIAGDWRTQLNAWAHEIFRRFLRHPWSLDTTAGVRPVGPNEVGWLEQALTALAGAALSGAEKLDVAATLVGHARAIAQQAPAGDNAEQALASAFATLINGREDRYPALAEALRSPGAQNQALEFGLDRILDGVELLITARA